MNHTPSDAVPIKIGVVGLGYWGPNLARVLQELPDADLRWACDVNPDALATIARRHPGLKVTTRFEDLVNDPELDAVAIATPVSTHAALSRRALEAGKHVFVEKPLAASVAEVEEMMETAETNDLVLMPGHTFLYSPPVNLVRNLIKDGTLGEIYFITMSRVNLGLHQSDVSVAWDLGPHDFSILRYWLEELPVQVSALSRSCIIPRVPDVAFVNLTFGSGTIAHIELSWLAPGKLRRTAIVGSEKMVIYDDTSNEPVRIFDSGVIPHNPTSFGEYALTYRAGDVISPRIEAVEPLAVEMSDFLQSIRSSSRPVSSAEVGLDVVRIIETVDESLRRGGIPVALSAIARR